jgi:hypothetical protein
VSDPVYATDVIMEQDPRRRPDPPDEERKIREAALDRTIEATFPASDPPSSNPNPRDYDALREDEHGE